MTQATVVQKWGNSLAVRIPKDVAERIAIQQGSEMELNVVNDEIITLVPKQRPMKYSLEELLAQITPENRHEEIEFGTEGNEVV
ncbi:AbrB/MazE/SpoVT family DNA-binding domain-containing protein [Bacillus sp. V3-13]|uniref:AbrB/MazE/SpoVT family DNA-binding domain-containing protein n=1 Tax=Bacillus sp. V3-13 TaxID=2053728 RepID=UPI000C775FD7|nr:AbrB/MazE/SpoVT family DNA-binding domain-containing protein [Bacillus sp. V3-13]PLR75671.1 AbrB/MazE/SpoVT family DNA-binding domain-containing protein [Bacillus sp. V3-13]